MNSAAEYPAITQPAISTDKSVPSRLTMTHEIPEGHLFVSNVRFLAMAAVVCIHCIGQFGELANIAPAGILNATLVQPFKFGSIGFFLISGFLMGEGLTRRDPIEYLQRRIKTVFRPWLIWFSILLALVVAVRAYGDPSIWHIRELLGSFSFVLFATPYWFVPNLLLSISILLVCRRFLHHLRFGAILLSFSIFYGLNIYRQWLPVQSHSRALLGFVFYLWLGAWAASNFARVQKWIDRTPFSALIAINVLAWCGALLESSVLAGIRPSDYLDTLRLTNQIYAVSMVLTIVKLRRPIWPRRINVRATTFGVHLAHSVVYVFLYTLLKSIGIQTLFVHRDLLTAISTAFLLTGSFVLTYGISLLLTELLVANPSLSWVVGSTVVLKAEPARECQPV